MMPKRKFAGSRVQKRSVSFGRGRKSSLSLEEEFWACLRKIAGDQGLSLGRLIATIDEQRQDANLPPQFGSLCWTTIAGWRRQRCIEKARPP